MSTILITGASSGIGLSTAMLLHEQGHRVYGTSRQARNDLPFPIIRLDLTQPDSIAECIKEFFEYESQLDVLINNAGKDVIAAVEETPDETMRSLFELHYFGVVALTKAFLPQMRERKQGKIINVTSIAGIIALPFESHYSASKAALELFSEALQREVENFGIHVVLIEPGDVISNIRKNAEYFQESEIYSDKVEYIRSYGEKQANFLPSEYIAKGISRAVNAKKPRLRYLLGAPLENLGVILKRFLPDNIFWYIAKRYMFQGED